MPPSRQPPHLPLRRAAASAVLTLLLAGCATTLTAPAVTPQLGDQALAAWSRSEPSQDAATDDAQLATWWQQFGDPMLDSLVQQALSNNRELQAAQANLRQARAARAAAEAGAAPNVGSSA